MRTVVGENDFIGVLPSYAAALSPELAFLPLERIAESRVLPRLSRPMGLIPSRGNHADAGRARHPAQHRGGLPGARPHSSRRLIERFPNEYFARRLHGNRRSVAEHRGDLQAHDRLGGAAADRLAHHDLARGPGQRGALQCLYDVSIRPPIVIVNCARRARVSKDTARNAEATGGFVLNVVSEDLASIVHKTAEFYPPEVSETDALGIELAPSRRVAAPRIAAAPVNLECKLLQILEFGEERDQNLVGEVVYFHVRDSIYANGKIDQTRLRPLARLGGPTYARLGEFITMPVPTSTE